MSIDSNNTVNSSELKAIDKTKLEILASRLGISFNEAKKLQADLRINLAKTLGITTSAVIPDIEPAGRELNLAFVINKQNLPRKKQ